MKLLLHSADRHNVQRFINKGSGAEMFNGDGPEDCKNTLCEETAAALKAMRALTAEPIYTRSSLGEEALPPEAALKSLYAEDIYNPLMALRDQHKTSWEGMVDSEVQELDSPSFGIVYQAPFSSYINPDASINTDQLTQLNLGNYEKGFQNFLESEKGETYRATAAKFMELFGENASPMTMIKVNNDYPALAAQHGVVEAALEADGYYNVDNTEAAAPSPTENSLKYLSLANLAEELWHKPGGARKDSAEALQVDVNTILAAQGKKGDLLEVDGKGGSSTQGCVRILLGLPKGATITKDNLSRIARMAQDERGEITA